MRMLQFTLAAALLCLPAHAQDSPTPSGDIKNGEKLFMADGCWQCHGIGGNGAGAVGPKLSRTVLPFDAFLHQLRQPAAEMAPYEASVVTDKSAADIYAFLKSRPASPDAKNLPLLMGMGEK